ncbi:hypothetical protein C4F50_17045 [Flavobacterium sp. KB82]|uniref:Uncharacterized protein n=1 Tax=Flavobacterium hungaricum TaxID=2082725 RepID=A0ABR9TNM7_9FLAO|nr:hypothetical protein [Flavobacterium hungaricum]
MIFFSFFGADFLFVAKALRSKVFLFLLCFLISQSREGAKFFSFLILTIKLYDLASLRAIQISFL